jgi:hypothetical protein
VSVETTVVTLHGDRKGLTFTDRPRENSSSVRYVVPQTAISLHGLLSHSQKRARAVRAKERDDPDSDWHDNLLEALGDFADLQGLAIRVGEDGDDPTIRQPLEGSVR